MILIQAQSTKEKIYNQLSRMERKKEELRTIESYPSLSSTPTMQHPI